MDIFDIYAATCRTYNRTPNDDQAAAWNRALGDLPPVDVRSAIDEWTRKTEESESGIPRGTFFPMPADIRCIIRAREAAQESQRQDGLRFKYCAKCDLGGWVWITVTENGRNIRKLKRCECWNEYAMKKRSRQAA